MMSKTEATNCGANGAPETVCTDDLPRSRFMSKGTTQQGNILLLVPNA
jgi:hypothetical protein